MKINLIEKIPTPFIFVTAPIIAAAAGAGLRGFSGLDENLKSLEEIGNNAMLTGFSVSLSAFAVICILGSLLNANKGKNVL